MRFMSQDSVSKSIVESVDGIRVDSAEISGSAEFEVCIDESELPDELGQIRSWVESTVEDYLERELSESGYDISCQARASDITEDYPILYSDLDSTESKYSVWVQFQ
jgi:hypothetical protein